MKTILSLDQQPDVARAVLYDSQARIVAHAEHSTPVIRPTRDREEQDAIGLARSMLDAASDAIERAGDGRQPSAIGISVPRDAIVVWDPRTGEPVAPAIVGRDIRAISACRALTDANFEISIRHHAALTIDPRFGASRLAWMLDEDAALRKRAERGELAFGTLDSWLVWTLTGGAEHLIGVANAAGTSLYNFERNQWDERLARIFGVPMDVYPAIVPSAGLVATLASTSATLEQLAPALHEPLRRLLRVAAPKTPILAMSTERSATLVGQQCIAPATASATFDGDRTTLLYNTGPAPVRSHSDVWSSIAWHYPIPSDEPIDPFGDDFLLPEFPVETWDSQRGWVTTMEVVVLRHPVVLPQDREYAYCFEGSLDHDRVSAIDRALAVCDLVARMEGDMAMKISALRVDGAAASDDDAMQVQADLLGVPVCRPDASLTSALGVALLAGTAAGIWTSLDAAARSAATGAVRVFEPTLDAATRDAQVLGWRVNRP